MRVFPRLLIVALMLGSIYLLINHVRGLSENEVSMSQTMTYYVLILALSAVTALVFCLSLLPLLGELAGKFVFTPDEQIERNPHADALAKIAAGDLLGAVEAYKEVFEENPSDTHAASEVVHLYCDKLHDPDSAASFLAEALSIPDRPTEETVFLSQRMVDVCWVHQHDGIRARAILIKIAEDLPETRYAANALHRLQEIDRVMNQEVYMPHGPGVATYTEPVFEHAETQPVAEEGDPSRGV